MNLIVTLQAQHKKLVRAVGAINDLVAAKDAAGIRASLGPFAKALLEHLALEDRELYPALIRGSTTQGQAPRADAARKFSTSMLRITEGVKGFLGKYQDKDIDVAAFARDWSGIASVLAGRIESEEHTLYPLYEDKYSLSSPLS